MFRNRPSHHPRVVLATAYIIVAVCIGHIYTMGALFPHIMELFSTNRAEAAVVQSTALALFSIGGVFYGIFISRVGPQFGCVTGTMVATVGLVISFFATSLVCLTITFGVLYGIGLALQFLASIVVVGQSFEGRQNSIALSVLSTAVGVGAIVYNFFLVFLLDSFGLRGTLLILAAMTLHGLPLAAVWPPFVRRVVPPNNDRTVHDDLTTAATNTQSTSKRETDKAASLDTFQESFEKRGNKAGRLSCSFNEGFVKDTDVNDYGATENPALDNQTPVCETQQKNTTTTNTFNIKMNVLQRMAFVLRDINFLLIATGISVLTSISEFILIVIVDLATDKGFTETDGEFALLDINLFSIAGRMAPGLLVLIPRITILTAAILGSLLGCISYILLAFSASMSSILIACALSGTTFGLMKTCLTVAPVKLTGKEYIPEAMGIVFTLAGVISAFAGPLTGYIRDQTGSYTPSLLSAAAAMLVFGTGIFGVNQYLRVKQRPKSEVPIVDVYKDMILV